MKLNIRTYAVIMSLSLANHIAFAENTITYQNTRGSTLELNFNEQNTLTGTFTTAVASKECQDVIGLARPIIGYIDGTAITFSVNYPTCGSVVTLTGHINSNKEKIDTIAIIAHQMSSFTEGPGSQFISHDTFIKSKG
ncbi:avidin/streptavidin family protein [Legionella pneumophila]|uniref:avidin/streptavidin family protein n=1 Tax=Legionella pneumophila TaxID=446 RepID=UPI0022443D38|nr:avidin/streptavidin family protein [Legionella pneumophila]MCW8405366.1 avidin/streptavidin family protein [Legionella pneumophila]